MKFCSNCQEWQESWADHLNYETSWTYKRRERCWKCNEWTLSERAIYVPFSSSLNRETVREKLNNVKEGRISRFVCGAERNVFGEVVRETLIYDGRETYAVVVEKDGRQIVEIKALKTLEEVLFLEFFETFIESPQLFLCSIQ